MGKPKRKHEPDSDEEELKPNVSPGAASARARPWTGAEQQLLLDLMLEKGKPEAFKCVPGRTYNQCRLAWR